MERIVTSMDQHGRMLIPVNIRERFNINPGEKVTLEITDDQLKIINGDSVIDEMHNLFTKNKTNIRNSHVKEFIKQKRQEYLIEEQRGILGNV
jgi:AbrB family looped-hinge helix DNA binding protein